MGEQDYVTVNPASSGHKFNAVIMRWSRHDDSYYPHRVSAALPEVAAKQLAQSWANALGLEYR